MTLVVTQAGLAKAMQADQRGISFKITHVGIGTTGYTPDSSMTELQSESVRVALSGGKEISSNQMHLTALFDGEAEIIGREVGFYLEDGTLFAVDSHPTDVLVYKSASTGSRVLEGFDLIFEAIPPNSITVDTSGDLTFYYAHSFAVMAVAQINNMRRSLINLKHFYFN